MSTTTNRAERRSFPFRLWLILSLAALCFPAAPAAGSTPTITLHPAATTTVLTGQVIVLSTSASGSPAPASQWQVSVNGGASWVNIPGATGPNLSFAARRADNGKQYRNVFTNADGTASTTAAALFVRLRVRADLDNNRRSDLIVWRPSTGLWSWVYSYESYTEEAKQWGNAGLGDVPMSGDIDGDGRMDLVVWRGSTGTWYWLTSSSGYAYAAAGSKQWGNLTQGDVPLLGDIDADGRSDLIVWRAGTGTWFWLLSSTNYDYAQQGQKQWGNAGLGDKPLLGDFDGDGLADLTVWRASTGTWFWLTSVSSYNYASQAQKQWGNSGLGDMPMTADMDGDGVEELVVWRASTGTFYWLTAISGFDYAAARSIQWGLPLETPLLGDLDGDGAAELIVYWAGSPGTATWHWLTSSSGFALASGDGKGWGARGDIPMIK